MIQLPVGCPKCRQFLRGPAYNFHLVSVYDFFYAYMRVLQRRLWLSFITFVFLPSLVCTSEVTADVTSAFCVHVFSGFFFGLHIFTCGSPFFSLHLVSFKVASVLRMISFCGLLTYIEILYLWY